MNLVKSCTMNCSGRTQSNTTEAGGQVDCEDCDHTDVDIVTARFDKTTHLLVKGTSENLAKLRQKAACWDYVNQKNYIHVYKPDADLFRHSVGVQLPGMTANNAIEGYGRTLESAVLSALAKRKATQVTSAEPITKPPFQYLVTDLTEGLVTGTNDLNKALQLSASCDHFVVDVASATWLSESGKQDIQSLD